MYKDAGVRDALRGIREMFGTYWNAFSGRGVEAARLRGLERANLLDADAGVALLNKALSQRTLARGLTAASLLPVAGMHILLNEEKPMLKTAAFAWDSKVKQAGVGGALAKGGKRYLELLLGKQRGPLEETLATARGALSRVADPRFFSPSEIARAAEAATAATTALSREKAKSWVVRLGTGAGVLGAGGGLSALLRKKKAPAFEDKLAEWQPGSSPWGGMGSNRGAMSMQGVGGGGQYAPQRTARAPSFSQPQPRPAAPMPVSAQRPAVPSLDTPQATGNWLSSMYNTGGKAPSTGGGVMDMAKDFSAMHRRYGELAANRQQRPGLAGVPTEAAMAPNPYMQQRADRLQRPGLLGINTEAAMAPNPYMQQRATRQQRPGLAGVPTEAALVPNPDMQRRAGGPL